MSKVDFFGWKIRFKDGLRAIKDNDAKEIIIIEGILELNAMIRIYEQVSFKLNLPYKIDFLSIYLIGYSYINKWAHIKTAFLLLYQ